MEDTARPKLKFLNILYMRVYKYCSLLGEKTGNTS